MTQQPRGRGERRPCSAGRGNAEGGTATSLSALETFSTSPSPVEINTRSLLLQHYSDGESAHQLARIIVSIAQAIKTFQAFAVDSTFLRLGRRLLGLPRCAGDQRGARSRCSLCTPNLLRPRVFSLQDSLCEKKSHQGRCKRSGRDRSAPTSGVARTAKINPKSHHKVK